MSDEVKQGHAVELFHQDGKSAHIFYCSKCGVVHSTKIAADQCHGNAICEKCGGKVKYGVVCDDCQHEEFKERERAKEAENFEKAEKIAAKGYEGFVFCDGASHNDGYFESVEDFIDWAEDEYEDPSQCPVYVWACNSHPPRRVDLSDITSNLLDDMWEDADEYDLNGIPELQAAIDAFNEANKTILIYETDYTRAVMLSWEAECPNK
jgi:hypothetical protein